MNMIRAREKTLNWSKLFVFTHFKVIERQQQAHLGM